MQAVPMPIDSSARIAPTARVHPDAVIGAGVLVGEFAIVERDVTIGAGTACSSRMFT